MKWITPLVVALAVTAHADTAPAPESRVLDRVAIVVDGAPIFESDIGVRGTEAQLIDEALLSNEADRLVITVLDEEVERAIDEIKKANGLDDAALEAALHDQGYTRASYEIEIRRQLRMLRARGVMFGGQSVEAQEAALASWLTEQRAHAYLERPR